MMEPSEFTAKQPPYGRAEQLPLCGATCDAYRVKLHGKLHFLKQLKPQYANDIRHREALRKEFETGYRLEHPHLVRYISMSDNGILMEHVDGETLAQVLNSHPNSLHSRKQADRFLRQLLSVVAYLHAHQVLHLDLKPDNIMLTHIGHDVKLIDLGCCLTDTFTDTTGHTRRFAAPEQLRGGSMDERTDIFALGRMMQLLPCHDTYKKVAARCTAENPQDRYQTVEELQHALFKRKNTQKHMAYSIPLLSLAGAIVYGLSPRVAPKPEPPVNETHPAIAETERTTEPPTEPMERIVVAQPTAPPQKDDLTRMREETERLMDAAYKATILTFCDSLFPSPSPTAGESWSKASTEFHDKSLAIGTQMASKYPQLAESTVRMEAERQFQALVAYVFNRMRENAAQTNSEE